MNLPALSSSAAEEDNESQQAVRRWPAQLSLGFERNNGGTKLARRRHFGPLCVQKPFYPEGPGVCHTYVLHPPAGIAGGDALNIDVEVDRESEALVTTPAATKFYRANPYPAKLTQHISVESEASIEWLPQGNIFFDGAEVLVRTIMKLKQDSRLIAWDSQCLGRPACREIYSTGTYQQRFEVWVEEQPLLIDSLGLSAGSTMQASRWGLSAKAVNAILVAYPADKALLESVNIHIERDIPDCAATLVDGLLLVRCFGEELDSVHNRLSSLWQLLRPSILGKEACTPRIWNT